MTDTSESIKEVAAIKKSCNIDTPLAMVMAAKLQKTVPVTYIKDIIQKKSFTFKLPYAINEKTSGIAELTTQTISYTFEYSLEMKNGN